MGRNNGENVYLKFNIHHSRFIHRSYLLICFCNFFSRGSISHCLKLCSRGGEGGKLESKVETLITSEFLGEINASTVGLSASSCQQKT